MNHYVEKNKCRNKLLISKYKLLKYYHIKLLIDTNKNDFVSFIEKIISCDKTLKILNLFRNDNPIPIKSLGKCIDLFSMDFINKKEYNI